MSTDTNDDVREDAPAGGSEREVFPDPAPAGRGPAPDREHQEETEAAQSGKRSPVTAGQWAAGGLSSAAVGAAGLYQLAGPWGLAAGGATLAAAGAVYGVHRLRKGRDGSGRRGRRERPLWARAGASRPGRAGRLGGLLGPAAGGLGRMKTPRAGGGRGRSASMASGGLGKGAASRVGAARSGGLGSGPTGGLGRLGRLGRTAGAGGGVRMPRFSGTGARTGGARTGRLGGLGGLLGGASGARSARAGRMRGRSHSTVDGGYIPRSRARSGGLGRAGLGGRLRTAAGRAGPAARTVGRAARWAGGKVAASPVGTRIRARWRRARKTRTFKALWAALAVPMAALWRLVTPTKPTTEEKAEDASATDADTGPTEDSSSTGADAGPTEDSSSDPGPTPGPETTTPTESTHESRVSVSVNPLTAAAAEMNSAVSRYVPEDMWAVRQEIRQLPQMCENVALAFRAYVTRLNDNYPIDPAVLDAMYQLFRQLGETATTAADIGPVFERIHEAEIRRRDTPRPNERAWNV